METTTVVSGRRAKGDKIKIYIGYDPREHVAYDVARHSILSRTDSNGVQIIPLELKNLGHILTRPIEHKDGKLWCPISQAPMATEFAISRFCVPFLQHDGWALFVDCDILCLTDIRELFTLADNKYAVMVVKHQQEHGPNTKMDGQVQTYYARKNWSSVVLWNCSHPANTMHFKPEYLNTWPGRDLHAFRWLDDYDIGELPADWNWLVDVQPQPSTAKLVHLTLGGPWFQDWKGGAADALWNSELKRLQGECKV